MIKAYSQRLSSPYSGQVQIAETKRARAVTIDGETWEIHFLRTANGANNPSGHDYKGSFVRVTTVMHKDLPDFATQASRGGRQIDERILELTNFLATASLPFTSLDKFEYWLLDPKDDSPLALIYTCSEGEQMALFPSRPEWTALPAAIMPIRATEAEKLRSDPPVNYRLERLVAKRAGRKPHARWFHRHPNEPDEFPPLMIREDWPDDAQHEICQRYLNRQSTRLLMLHGLQVEERKRLELAAKSHAMEVLRFYTLYPEFVDEELMRSILVEARLRAAMGESDGRLERRDGVLYL